MLLDEVVRTWAAVSASPGRLAKVAELARLLRATPLAEIPIAVSFLSGELTQRQIGVGYAAIMDVAGRTEDQAAGSPALTLTETDAAFSAIGKVTGAGSQAARRALLAGLFARATAAEHQFLVRLLAGDLRQGALAGVMTEAIAAAAGVQAADVRRAHQLSGSLAAAASAALGPAEPAPAKDTDEGEAADDGRTAALRSVLLEVGRPVRPMLAASAPTVADAMARMGQAAVEWKIDGIRVQVHRTGDSVRVFTRTLDDITQRVPEIVSAGLSLHATSAVIDGEAIALRADGRPRPFQVTAARTASQADAGGLGEQVPLTLFIFDLLHADGTDLMDVQAADRFARLQQVAPAEMVIPRIMTSDTDAAEAFFADAVARGHEGVVVKSPQATYGAGRRGSEWIKVKPRHTLDLVVLAAEWGHGRRQGWLSNLHLGARDPRTGGLVMLGKTFKGLTDAMLTWQTERLLALADPPQQAGLPADGQPPRYGVVRVRPELVVEIAFDGVQGSSRYPGGVALRFARVLRYRPDKSAAAADTIDAVREFWAPDDGDDS